MHLRAHVAGSTNRRANQDSRSTELPIAVRVLPCWLRSHPNRVCFHTRIAADIDDNWIWLQLRMDCLQHAERCNRVDVKDVV